MFTGIIECLGEVTEIIEQDTNIHYRIKSSISEALKIDQSVAHNGVCLTVVELGNQDHVVTAILETLEKSNLKSLSVGDAVNLERCMQMNGRLDGHIVQGHVDLVGTCIGVEDKQGSWLFSFEYDSPEHITVEKGSICVNGTSLTVVDAKHQGFSVAIIPYTYENTFFKYLKQGNTVNLEFDIIGKYVAQMMLNRN